MKYAKHPRDPNQRAKSVVDLSTGEKEPEPLPDPVRAPRRKPGHRTKALSPAQRHQRDADGRWNTEHP